MRSVSHRRIGLYIYIYILYAFIIFYLFFTELLLRYPFLNHFHFSISSLILCSVQLIFIIHPRVTFQKYQILNPSNIIFIQHVIFKVYIHCVREKSKPLYTVS